MPGRLSLHQRFSADFAPMCFSKSCGHFQKNCPANGTNCFALLLLQFGGRLRASETRICERLNSLSYGAASGATPARVVKRVGQGRRKGVFCETKCQARGHKHDYETNPLQHEYAPGGPDAKADGRRKSFIRGPKGGSDLRKRTICSARKQIPRQGPIRAARPRPGSRRLSQSQPNPRCASL
jgi:hypothetical protein